MLVKKIIFIGFIASSFSFCSVKMNDPDPLDGMDLRWKKEDGYTMLEAINKKEETVAWAKVFKEGGNMITGGNNKLFFPLLERLYGTKGAKKRYKKQ